MLGLASPTVMGLASRSTVRVNVSAERRGLTGSVVRDRPRVGGVVCRNQ